MKQFLPQEWDSVAEPHQIVRFGGSLAGNSSIRWQISASESTIMEPDRPSLVTTRILFPFTLALVETTHLLIHYYQIPSMDRCIFDRLSI